MRSLTVRPTCCDFCSGGQRRSQLAREAVGVRRNLSAAATSKLSCLKIPAAAAHGIMSALTPNWGRPGFDVGYEAAQGMPRSSHLVKQLEHTKRERRALRSRRLTPARRCTSLLMG